MSVINTNITSLIGQQNLMKSQSSLATSMERLSSGLRINSAKDDAAGLAVANRMSAQITGLGQAQRNANDGISVAQTAEGAANQVNDNLQRIRELTVQASNGTNSQDDLKSIQAEIGQRLSEIDRISQETDFNGTKVLASDQELKIQVGANDGETISVNLKEINSTTLNLDTFNVSGAKAATADDLFAKAAENNTVAFMNNAATPAEETFTKQADGTWQKGTDATTNITEETLRGRIEDEANGAFKATLGTTNYVVSTDDAVTTGGEAVYVENDTLTAESALTGQAATQDPLAALDAALSQVDTLRSDLGAVQNRFDSAITNMSTTSTNLSAARSRIEDADYAVEVANMTRSQILQQAGTSVLAQANQVPQSVLSLLG